MFNPQLPDNLKTIHGYLTFWGKRQRNNDIIYDVFDKPNCVIVATVSDGKNLNVFKLPNSDEVFRKVIENSFNDFVTGETYATEDDFNRDLHDFISDFIWTF